MEASSVVRARKADSCLTNPGERAPLRASGMGIRLPHYSSEATFINVLALCVGAQAREFLAITDPMRERVSKQEAGLR